MAQYLNTKIFLINVNRGVKGAVKGIEDAIEHYEADLILCVDGGGDSLAKGTEKRLISPLADSLILASAYQISKKINVAWSIFGFGCDGELTYEELSNRITELAKRGGYIGAWGITNRIQQDLSVLVRSHRSDVSKLVLKATKGQYGEIKIREGTRNAYVSPLSAIVLFFDVKILFNLSPIAKALIKTDDLIYANEILHHMDIKTEFDLEKIAYSKSVKSYRNLPKY